RSGDHTPPSRLNMELVTLGATLGGAGDVELSCYTLRTVAAYTVYLLNNPDSNLKPLIETKAAEIGLPLSAIAFETSAVDTSGLTVGVFWGSVDHDPAAVAAAKTLVDGRVPMFPVHHGSFDREIPSCLHAVNGFHSARGLDDLANSA